MNVRQAIVSEGGVHLLACEFLYRFLPSWSDVVLPHPQCPDTRGCAGRNALRFRYSLALGIHCVTWAVRVESQNALCAAWISQSGVQIVDLQKQSPWEHGASVPSGAWRWASSIVSLGFHCTMYKVSDDVTCTSS